MMLSTKQLKKERLTSLHSWLQLGLISTKQIHFTKRPSSRRLISGTLNACDSCSQHRKLTSIWRMMRAPLPFAWLPLKAAQNVYMLVPDLWGIQLFTCQPNSWEVSVRWLDFWGNAHMCVCPEIQRKRLAYLQNSVKLSVWLHSLFVHVRVLAYLLYCK